MAKANPAKKVKTGGRKTAKAGGKKAAPTKANKKANKKAKKKAEQALSAAEKRRLLKPLRDYPELLKRLIDTWRSHARQVRMPGMTSAALAARLRKAIAASAREDALRTKLEQRLQPLADARLRAESDAWKGALDLYAMLKSAARNDPGLMGPFAFFAEAVTHRSSAAPAAAAATTTPPA